MVHAHLRLGQMALVRMISEGRISEMAGPFTSDIDHALKCMDFGFAIDKSHQENGPED